MWNTVLSVTGWKSYFHFSLTKIKLFIHRVLWSVLFFKVFFSSLQDWYFSAVIAVVIFYFTVYWCLLQIFNAKKQQQSCLCSRSRQSSCGGCWCFVIINFTFWLLRVVPSSPGVSVLCNHEVISRASTSKTGTSPLGVWGEDFCPFCCTCRRRKSYIYMAKATFSIYGSPYMCSHPSIFGKQMMAIQINLSVLYLFAERLKEFLGILSASWLF